MFDTDGVVTRTAAVALRRVEGGVRPVPGIACTGSAGPPLPRRGLPPPRGRDRAVRRRRRASWPHAGIALDRGAIPIEPPGDGTICALGNRKDAAFADAVRRHGVAPYLTTCRFVEQLRAAGIRTAVVSPAATARWCSRPPGCPTCSRCGSTDASWTSSVCRASPTPRCSWRPQHDSESGRPGAAVVEDAVSGVRAGRARGLRDGDRPGPHEATRGAVAVRRPGGARRRRPGAGRRSAAKVRARPCPARRPARGTRTTPTCPACSPIDRWRCSWTTTAP